MKCKIRTEQSTIITTNVIFKGNYLWVEEDKTLYRILAENDESIQPDGILTIDDIVIKICRVAKFANADVAFSTMEYNIAAMKEAMKDLENSLKKSEKTNEKEELSPQPKTYVANYIFNYFGGDKIDDKIIVGACIDIALRPYKNGKLIQFQSEKETYFSLELPSRVFGVRKETIYFSDIVTVSYDREKCFLITLNTEIMKLMCEHFKWDTIKVEAINFQLDYAESEWMSAPWDCGKEVFTKFIIDHADDFDISDNENAQCPSCSWLQE